MLRLTDITFRRGDDTILDGLSFAVHAGQRVGLVGRNGCGKSTVLALIRGAAAPEDGDLDKPASWRIAHLAQETQASERSALDFVLDGHREFRRLEAAMATADGTELAHLTAEFEAIDGYRVDVQARAVMTGLGFDSGDFERPHASFSGGWRIRLALARALLQPSDLLLLDEPTNHLDVQAIAWLENFLLRYDGTLITVAHEREFLDRIAQHIVHIERGRARTYRGNYSTYERVAAEELANLQAQRAKQDKVAARLDAFISRFRAKATKAKQVQSRIKVLEKMQLAAPLQAERGYDFSFGNPDKLSTPLISLTGVSAGYDGNSPVLTGVSQSILPGARIALVGANGAGKSTLLRTLAGELPPMAGEITRGRHSEIAYFAQDQLEALNLAETALAMFTRLAPELREQQIRDLLGGWGFDAAAISRPIKTLSGGEKARLVLAQLSRQQPALLVLDEPSNHLDMDMRDALTIALQDYDGAVVLVAHDRHLMRAVAEEFWIVASGGVTRSTDTLEEVLESLDNGSPSVGEGREDKPSGPSAAERRAARAAARKELAPLTRELRTIETAMAKLETDIAGISAELADTERYAAMSGEEINERIARHGKLSARQSELEERWLELSEEIEERERAQQ